MQVLSPYFSKILLSTELLVAELEDTEAPESVICFYLGCSGSIRQFRQVMATYLSSNITLSLPSYTGSALERAKFFVTAILVCCIFA